MCARDFISGKPRFDRGADFYPLSGDMYSLLPAVDITAFFASHGFSSDIWLRGPNTHYLFENRDDPREFWLDPDGPEVTIVGGAGVDPAQFPLLPLPPAPPVKVAVVARMIWPKGIAEAVEAARYARVALGAPIELHLFGGLTRSNRRPIDETVLREWLAEPGITWHGATDNAPRVWREHHVALFLSYYREGLPRTLVEAAAAGRPIVTTNVTGCRDVVRDGIEGILCRPATSTRRGARSLGSPAIRRCARAWARRESGFSRALHRGRGPAHRRQALPFADCFSRAGVISLPVR